MSNRTIILTENVLRKLRQHNVKTTDISPGDVIATLNQAQDNIISEVQPRKTIVIELQTGIDSYPLSTDTGIPISRKNIAKISVGKLPGGWTSSSSDFNNQGFFPAGFNIIPDNKFAECINSSSVTTGRPVIGTVIDNQLKVAPAPAGDYDGDEIELYVNISSAATKITQTVEPELEAYWDNALELFTLAQFLTGQSRAQTLNEYNIEVRRLRPITSRNNFPPRAESAIIW
jgi:hypothetical protein